MRKLHFLGLAVVCLLVAAGSYAQGGAKDPLSGTWVGDWGPSASDRNQVTVELKYDGKSLAGTVNPGANAVPLQKCTYDSKTHAVHMEADAKGHSGQMVHYKIDGKVEGSTLSGTWNHDAVKGDFKITKKS
ncbi:MAG TPA: hypothetical protein VMX54_19465 [Vicinamibacteria bacterium]|nr:hypothetical protein [Vicinamibacteria bacterium]